MLTFILNAAGGCNNAVILLSLLAQMLQHSHLAMPPRHIQRTHRAGSITQYAATVFLLNRLVTGLSSSILGAVYSQLSVSHSLAVASAAVLN